MLSTNDSAVSTDRYPCPQRGFKAGERAAASSCSVMAVAGWTPAKQQMELGRTHNAGSPPGLLRHGWLRLDYWKGSFGPEGAAGREQAQCIRTAKEGSVDGGRTREGAIKRGQAGGPRCRVGKTVGSAS